MTPQAIETGHESESQHYNITMKQKNTKAHWIATAVLGYYNRHGVAPRTKDLLVDHENAPDFMADIDQVSSNLSNVSYRVHDGESFTNERPIASSKIIKEDGEMPRGQPNKYWPTPLTVETLRDFGAPTKLPNGKDVSHTYTFPENPDCAPEDANPMHETTDKTVEWKERKALTPGQREPQETEGDDRDPGDPYVCSFCGEEFDADNEAEYSAHTQNHVENMTCNIDDEPEFVCDCGAEFDESKEYQAHVGACDDALDTGDTYECDDCGETFDDLREYQRHAPSNCTEDDDTIVDDALAEVTDDDDDEVVYGGSMIDTIMEQSHDFVDISNELDVDESEMEPDVVVNV